MDDLISRQAAIALAEEIETKWLRGQIELTYAPTIKGLQKLPSVQPERSVRVQEILDYLDAELHPIVSPRYWDVYSNLYDMISSLSLAQHEIIRCKDCKHWFDIDDGRQKHRMCADVSGDWFCADAERRTE